ncbi:hypothetical protein SRB5_07700 [Streptomyces sp. RB5]|uniref:ABC transporter permease n=1 Tax=Streptomyces smaragdinus TaxID=2585196 RepID=A0A7K0CB58_9ACTN|nr:ABC transporter permease [Streptomyces smaragdinus]MQY10658.1 hypothetical protein [Streptomyces smaragdinus]
MSTTAVIRSELIKIRSLRGTAVSLLVLIALTAGFSWLTVGTSEVEDGNLDPLFHAFFGIAMGQIAAIAFGVLAVSSEYHGGALRISLAAVPRRGLFYGAKLAVIAGLTLAAGLLTGVATVLGDQALGGADKPAWGDEGVLRACAGSGLYYALLAVFAAGLTAVLRSGVGALSIMIPLILTVSFVIGDSAGTFADYLPDRAGQMIFYRDPSTDFGPWTGLAILAVWAAAAGAAGWWSVSRRDA